jgi:hypothetical protein
LQKSFNVIPAKPAPEVSSPGAGIQVFQGLLGPGYFRGDGFVEFCKRLGINRYGYGLGDSGIHSSIPQFFNPSILQFFNPSILQFVFNP